MRASPYDFSELGFEPVRIETPRASRSTSRASAPSPSAALPLRERLIAECERLLAASVPGRAAED